MGCTLRKGGGGAEMTMALVPAGMAVIWSLCLLLLLLFLLTLFFTLPLPLSQRPLSSEGEDRTTTADRTVQLGKAPGDRMRCPDGIIMLDGALDHNHDA